VLVNGKPVPMLAASYGRVDVQLPNDLTPGAASVVVSVPCGATQAVSFAVASTAPYIGLTNAGTAMAFHIDGSPVTNSNPAQAGTSVMILMTGIGTADHPSITASIGGFDATVQLSPVSSAPGWIQAKVAIPVGLNAGPYPVTISVNSVASNSAPLNVQ
jgi:uncharacterized protein (TIGR03437 family)